MKNDFWARCIALSILLTASGISTADTAPPILVGSSSPAGSGLPTPAESPLIVDGLELSLSSNEENKYGTLSADFKTQEDFIFGFKIRGKFDSGKQENASFGDLDGLKDANSITLSFGQSSINDTGDEGDRPASRLCKTRNAKLADSWMVEKKEIQKLGNTCKKKLKNCQEGDNNCKKGYLECRADLKKLIKQGNEAVALYNEISKEECPELSKASSSASLADVLRDEWKLSVSYSPEKFKWLDSTSFTEGERRRESYSAEIYKLWLLEKYTLHKVGYRYEDVWNSSTTSRQICSPVGSVAGTLSCQNSIIGAPSQKEASVFYYEYRTYFYDQDRFAVAPRASYDVEEEVTGINIPVYMYASGKTLNGGFELGWRSDTDDVSFGVFISKPFQLSK